MLGRQKFATDTKVQSVVHQWLKQSQHRSLHLAFRNLLTAMTNV